METVKTITDRVTCPTCGAGPGWPCRKRGGKQLPMHRNHKTRVQIVFIEQNKTESRADRVEAVWRAAKRRHDAAADAK